MYNIKKTHALASPAKKKEKEKKNGAQTLLNATLPLYITITLESILGFKKKLNLEFPYFT